LSPKDKKPKNTGMYAAMRSIMPGADLPEVKAAEQEQPVSAPNQAPRKGGRHRIPDDQKAVSKAYSFKPDVIRGLEAYARDHRISCSTAITQALNAMIPDSYFMKNS
jgi:hypothetical protein